MVQNIDNIISLMKQYTLNDIKDEIGEQDATSTTSGGGSKPTYPTVTKWETGAVRGPANQIGLTKWSDVVKINRGKANTLL
jgi:hypothetical protein